MPNKMIHMNNFQNLFCPKQNTHKNKHTKKHKQAKSAYMVVSLFVAAAFLGSLPMNNMNKIRNF